MKATKLDEIKAIVYGIKPEWKYLTTHFSYECKNSTLNFFWVCELNFVNDGRTCTMSDDFDLDVFNRFE